MKCLLLKLLSGTFCFKVFTTPDSKMKMHSAHSYNKITWVDIPSYLIYGITNTNIYFTPFRKRRQKNKNFWNIFWFYIFFVFKIGMLACNDIYLEWYWIGI